MRSSITIFLLFILSSILYGQLTPVKLGNWKHEGLTANGNWTISADSLSVRQSANDEPTFFVSPDTFQNVTIRGSFYVDGSDDDYIGFVFGYFRPDSAEEYFDFYLLDGRGAHSQALRKDLPCLKCWAMSMSGPVLIHPIPIGTIMTPPKQFSAPIMVTMAGSEVLSMTLN